jgi:arginase
VLFRSYDDRRDRETNCLNAGPIRDFSLTLKKVVSGPLNKGHFAFVLGGDCSILIGIMPSLKEKGTYGLIFFDAHADFYDPDTSLTGEAADMDLAIITGRGPKLLTNINNLQPYVKDENVIHAGQRDWEETKRYRSRDIRETAIRCFNLAEIENNGIDTITREILYHTNQLDIEGFWIHFDTDVLSDEINPAVDYRLPGGLSFEQIEILLIGLLSTGKVTGISVTIFNPALDQGGHISKNIAGSLIRAFDSVSLQ